MTRSPVDQAAAIAKAELDRIDVLDKVVGAFVRRFATEFEPVEEERSTFREDSVITELASLERDFGEDKIFLLDVCCGTGSLASNIVRSSPPPLARRVHYVGIDCDLGAVRAAEAREAKLDSGLGGYEILCRRVPDLDLPALKGRFALVVINNSLHEISPQLFPSLFETLNGLLHPTLGLMSITDLESLPADYPEASAITWSRDEMQAILQAGGFKPNVAGVKKRVNVYRAAARAVLGSVKREEMLSTIRSLLDRRLVQLLSDFGKARKELPVGGTVVSHEPLAKWVAASARLARIAEEISALEGASSPPFPRSVGN